MSIYKDQSAFDIVLDTSIDLSTADTVSIAYIKPDGTTSGSWTGSVTDTTKITYSVQAGDIDTAGMWSLQAVAVFGSRTAYGKETYMEVKQSAKP